MKLIAHFQHLMALHADLAFYHLNPSIYVIISFIIDLFSSYFIVFFIFNVRKLERYGATVISAVAKFINKFQVYFVSNWFISRYTNSLVIVFIRFTNCIDGLQLNYTVHRSVARFMDFLFFINDSK